MSTRPSADQEGSTAFRAAVSSLKPSAPPTSFFDDPYPWFDALREHRPVHPLDPGSWLLTRYDDVLAMYRSSAVRSDKQRKFGPKFGVGTPLHQRHTTSLVSNDPPRHLRVRRLLTGALRQLTIQRRKAGFVMLIDGLLDELVGQPSPDLFADFAARIPQAGVRSRPGALPELRRRSH